MLAVCALLAGCMEDKGAELARCDMEAQHTLSARSEGIAGFDPVGMYVRNCMRAKGYVFDWGKEGCWSLQGDSCYSVHRPWDDLLSQVRSAK